MLPGERHTGAQGEVASLAAQTPENLARLPVDLVDRPGVSARDEEVAVVVEVDRVDVEVVVGRVHRQIAVGDRHMVEAVPLEEDVAGGDVEPLTIASVAWPLLGPPTDERSYGTSW